MLLLRLPLRLVLLFSFVLLCLFIIECRLSSAGFLDDLSSAMTDTDEDPDSECVAEDSTIFLSLNTHFIKRLGSALAPYIDEKLSQFSIPPQVIPHGSTDEIFVENFLVEQLSTRFGVPSPHEMVVDISGLSFTIADSNFTISSAMTCNGVFWGEVQDLNISITIKMFLSEQHKFLTEVTNSSFEWGPIDLHHRLYGRMCKMTESVVKAFLGDLDELVKERLKLELPAQVNPMVDEQIHAMVETLPYPLSGGPHLEEDTVTFEMQLVNPDNVKFGKTNSRDVYLRKAKATGKSEDFALLIPEESVQNRFNYAHCKKLLSFHNTLPSQFNSEMLQNVMPELYHMCPNCLLAVSIDSETPWMISLNHEALDIAFGSIDIGAYMVTQNVQQARKIHSFLMDTEDELYKKRLWVTDDFTRGTPTEDNVKIPIGLIRINPILAMSQIYVLSLEEVVKISFQVDPVDDMDIEIREMNINGLEEKDIRSTVFNGMNFGVLGRLARNSPVELPSYFRKMDLDSNQDHFLLRGFISAQKLIEYVEKQMNEAKEAAQEQEE